MASKAEMGSNAVKGTGITDLDFIIIQILGLLRRTGYAQKTNNLFPYITCLETNGPKLLGKFLEGKRLKTCRTDNCVKNRFYTKFRRSIRFFNDCIKRFWKKQIKPLKLTLIQKFVNYLPESDVELSSCSQQHRLSVNGILRVDLDLK